MPDPKYSDPKGRLGSTAGLPAGGWQFPLADPGAATRNKLREMGMMGSPFNRQGTAMVDQLAASAYAQFLMEAAQGNVGGDNIANEFGNFLGQLISGERAPMGMSQAMGGLESLRGTLGGVSQKVSGAGIDANDPGALGQFAAQGGINPIEYAIAGLLADPQRQAQVYQGAMLPSMGPGMVKGMATAMAPMQQSYNDILEGLMFQDPKTAFSSLLDVLLGRFTGAPGSPAGPQLQGMMGPQRPQSRYGTPPPGF